MSSESNPIAVAIWTRHLSKETKPMTTDITKRIDPILADHRMTRDEYTSLLHHLVDRSARDGATEERERIAELERDLAHERNNLARASRLLDEERRNCEQHAQIIDTLRAELAALKSAKGAPFDEAGTVGPVVEEQGPWVVRDADCGNYIDNDDEETTTLRSARRFNSREVAQKACGGDRASEDWRILTLAEARTLAKVSP